MFVSWGLPIPTDRRRQYAGRRRLHTLLDCVTPDGRPTGRGMRQKIRQSGQAVMSVNTFAMPPPHRDGDDHSPSSHESRIDNQKSHQNDVNELQAIINERNRRLLLSRSFKY